MLRMALWAICVYGAMPWPTDRTYSVDRRMAAAAIKVPGLGARRVRRVDDGKETVRPGDVPELGECHADRRKVNVHGPARLVHAAAGRRAERRLPSRNKIGVRLFCIS